METLKIRKQKTEEFSQSLTERQKNAWENYKTIHFNVQFWNNQPADKQLEQFGEVFSE